MQQPSRRALLASVAPAMVALPLGAPAAEPCPVAALAPALAEAVRIAGYTIAATLNNSVGYGAIEDAMSRQPARSAVGALLHVILARQDVLSMLDGACSRDDEDALLARAERCLWSAIAVLAPTLPLPAPLGPFYADAHMNPFAEA